LFERRLADEKLIPWDVFLNTRHPLKTDAGMVSALSQLRRSGKSAVVFDVKPGSSYAGKVALFYSQAAVFGQFVSARSCRGRGAVGELLTNYDPRAGLDQWLRAHGTGLCLPRSMTEFEASFAAFVRQRTATDRPLHSETGV
jgi:hypothetical protein